jgi:hypothetical protein
MLTPEAAPMAITRKHRMLTMRHQFGGVEAGSGVGVVLEVFMCMRRR